MTEPAGKNDPKKYSVVAHEDSLYSHKDLEDMHSIIDKRLQGIPNNNLDDIELLKSQMRILLTHVDVAGKNTKDPQKFEQIAEIHKLSKKFDQEIIQRTTQIELSLKNAAIEHAKKLAEANAQRAEIRRNEERMALEKFRQAEEVHRNVEQASRQADEAARKANEIANPKQDQTAIEPIALPEIIIKDIAIVAASKERNGEVVEPGKILPPMMTDDRLKMKNRLADSIKGLINTAHDTHLLHNKVSGSNETRPHYITRLSTNEFFFTRKNL